MIEYSVHRVSVLFQMVFSDGHDFIVAWNQVVEDVGSESPLIRQSVFFSDYRLLEEELFVDPMPRNSL